MSKFKSILAFAAALLCGGAWATQVPYIAFDNSLPTLTGPGLTAQAPLSIKQSINSNADGSVTIGEDKGLTIGHAGSVCNAATFIIKGKGLKRAIASGKAVHVITLPQNNTSQNGGSHNKIGLALNSEGKLQGVWCNGLRDIAPSTQVALTSGDLLAITIGKSSGQGVVAWEYANGGWTKVFEDTTFLDSSCNYKGFTLGGPYLGTDDAQSYYVASTDITPATGWTISNVAMFNSILTEAQIAEYAVSLQDGTYRFAPILTSTYVDTGWKVNSIDELLNWSFTGEMTGNQTSNQPVAAKGWNAAKHTDGSVTVEFTASNNGKARGVSANFKLEDGGLKVKGVKGAYYNDTNRVVDDMFNNDGSPINPGSTTISVDLATTDTGAGQGLKNIVATPNYLMSNAAQTHDRASYDSLAMTLNLPATAGYPAGSKVRVRTVGVATECSSPNFTSTDLPAKLAINGIKSSSRTERIVDESICDGTRVGRMVYYSFDEGVELTVGTAASSVGFFNENDQAVTSARFELVATAGSAGTKLSALTINGVTNYAPVCTVYAEPVTIAPDNAVTFSGTLSHTAWVVLGKVATGETISDVALKYGFAVQLGGSSINSGTPLDAADRYAQIHDDNVLTVEMQCQDGSNKKSALVGFKVEGNLLKAKWLKSSYKATTANDRQMTYANGTVTVNSGFTAHDYEVTKIIITKANLLNTAVDKPSVLSDNDHLILHYDAASLDNFTIENGEVTQWNDLAGSNNATPGTATKGYFEVVNGVPSFQMGDAGSGIDLSFTQQTNIRTVFWVMDIKPTMAAFFLGDSNECHFHRGSNGEYAGSWAGNGWTQAAIKCDDAITSMGAIPPTGLHVFSAVTTEDRTACRLSQDRNQSGRNGGRAISELIVFDTALTDAQVQSMNRYLLAKWKGIEIHDVSATISGEQDFSTIAWDDGQHFADDYNVTLTVAQDTTATLDMDQAVRVSNLVLVGAGALMVENGQNLTVANVDASGFTGTLTYKVSATSESVTLSQGLLSYIQTAGQKFIFEGGEETGVHVDYEIGAALSSKMTSHLVFEAGKHTFKYRRSGGELFAENHTAEDPTVLVKDGATLDFTANDLSGWSGGANIGGVVRVNNGGKLNFLQNGTETFFYRQRLHLDPGAYVSFNYTIKDNEGCFRWQGGSNENTAQIYMPNSEAGSEEAVIEQKGTSPFVLASDNTRGLAFSIGANSKLRMKSAIFCNNTATFTKYGAGELILAGDMSSYTLGITVSAGTVTFSDTANKTYANVISGAGAVAKEGSGTLTLTGTSTYTGGTTVREGTLVVTTPNGNYTTEENGILKVEKDLSAGGTFPKPTIAANAGTVQLVVTMGKEALQAGTAVDVADLAEGITTTDGFEVAVINADTGNTVENELSIVEGVLKVTPLAAKQTLTYMPESDGSFEWTTGAVIEGKKYRDYDDIAFATTEFATAVTVPTKIAASTISLGGVYSFTGSPIIASIVETIAGANATFENDLVADTLTVSHGTVKADSVVARAVSVNNATFGAKVVGPSMRYVRLKVTETQGGSGNQPAVGEFRLYRGNATTGYTILDWPVGTKVLESTGKVAVKETSGYPAEVGAGVGNNGGNECQPGCLIDGYYGNVGTPAIYGSGAYNTPKYNKWWPTSQATGPWTVTIEFPYPVAMFSGCNFCLADHGPRNPTAWTIEVSNDGTNWTEVNNTSGATWSTQYAWYGGDENVPGFLNSGTTPTAVTVGEGATILADGNWTAALNVSGNVTLKGVSEKHLTLDAASTSSFAEGAALTLDLTDYGIVTVAKQYIVAGPLTGWPDVADIAVTPADIFELGKDAQGYYVIAPAARIGEGESARYFKTVQEAIETAANETTAVVKPVITLTEGAAAPAGFTKLEGGVLKACDYVVISPSAYVSDWQAYVDARQAMPAAEGLVLGVKNAKEIYTAYPYAAGNTDGTPRNAAESIHKWIGIMQKLGTKYFVLGGVWMDAQSLNADGEQVTWGSVDHMKTGETISLETAIPGVIAYPVVARGELGAVARNYPSDLYYACHFVEDGKKYVWDSNVDSMYLGPEECLDYRNYIPSCVVSRMDLVPSKYVNKTYRELIASYLEKLRKGESEDFGGNGKYVTYVNYCLGYDDDTGLPDVYGVMRDRLYSIVNTRTANELYLAPYNKKHPELKPGMVDRAMNEDWELSMPFGHGIAEICAYIEDNYYGQATGITKFFMANIPCYTGTVTTFNKTDGAVPAIAQIALSNPNGGSLVSINNTCMGQAATSGLAKRYEGISDEMLDYTLDSYVSGSTAGEAWMTAIATYANKVLSSTTELAKRTFDSNDPNAKGYDKVSYVISAVVEEMLFGDPLVAINERDVYVKNDTGYSKYYTTKAATKETTLRATDRIVFDKAAFDPTVAVDLTTAPTGHRIYFAPSTQGAPTAWKTTKGIPAELQVLIGANTSFALYGKSAVNDGVIFSGEGTLTRTDSPDSPVDVTGLVQVYSAVSTPKARSMLFALASANAVLKVKEKLADGMVGGSIGISAMCNDFGDAGATYTATVEGDAPESMKTVVVPEGATKLYLLPSQTADLSAINQASLSEIKVFLPNPYEETTIDMTDLFEQSYNADTHILSLNLKESAAPAPEGLSVAMPGGKDEGKIKITIQNPIKGLCYSIVTADLPDGFAEDQIVDESERMQVMYAYPSIPLTLTYDPKKKVQFFKVRVSPSVNYGKPAEAPSAN